MLKYLTFLTACLGVCCISFAQQTEQESIREAFRKGQEQIDAAKLHAMKPKPHYNGYEYIDSAYGFEFSTNNKDSIVNQSADGIVNVGLYNGFFFMKINSGNAGFDLEKFAKLQQQNAAKNLAGGAKEIKVSKVSHKHEKYEYTGYRYNIKYINKDGDPLIVSVRIFYTSYNYSAIIMRGLFPNDAAADEKEKMLDHYATSFSTFRRE